MNTIEKALIKKNNQDNSRTETKEILDTLAEQKVVERNWESEKHLDSISLEQNDQEVRGHTRNDTSSLAATVMPENEHTKQFIDETQNDIVETSGIPQSSPVNSSRTINIDLENLKHMGFLVPHGTNSVLNEEYRQIKRPLLNNMRGKSAHPIENANLLQVTSSLQGEGKTFTAINLALTFAMEMDLNVLLVDADVIKSSVTRTLINRTEKGLTDYLSGGVKELSEVLLATNIPKLKILPAGTRNQLSTELLNSQYMEQLIYEFSKRYDNRVVIIDSSPMLQTNEARILAHKVGQIVFVVEQNKTAQSAVKNALSLIDKDMVVGLVMNKSRTGRQGGYYGYYGPSE